MTEAARDERDIDARSIVTLITFFVVNILVLFPIPLRYDLSRFAAQRHKDTTSTTHARSGPSGWRSLCRPWRYQLGLEIAPVIGVLILLASTCIPGSVIRDGIVGSEGVRPYDILTLFLCFAYISLSLDSTGLLRYISAIVATRSSSSGSRLYTAFYVFFALTGLFIGNDPLILSGTPFLVYFTDDVKIQDPTAYLFTHFQVSNLVSALLVSSNPTNLILTSAFGISFLSYSAWLALPTVAAVSVLYPVLRYWQFNREEWLPPRLELPHVDPKMYLKDRWGGIFGATLFLITIVLLVGLSAGGLLEGWAGVWTVTLPAALAMLCWDCGRDLVVRRRKRHHRPAGKMGDVDQVEVKETRGQRLTPPPTASRDNTSSDLTLSQNAARAESGSQGGVVAAETIESDNVKPHPQSAPAADTTHAMSPRYPSFIRSVAETFPTPIGTLSRMPFNLVPFAFSMFILVEGLQYTGWIKVFGNWWAAWAKLDQVAGSVWLMAMLSVLGCNFFGTNIGATILLSRVLQYWQTHHGPVSNRTLYSAVFTLAVGSNFGAYSFVFSASLAGLLWRTILGQKGRTIGQLQFIRHNWLPVIVTMIVGCLVVGGEVCVIYED